LFGTSPHFPVSAGLEQRYGVQAQTPALHGPSLQSASREHFPPVAQGPQLPPQSLSVSRPFFTPSSQRAAAHLPVLQTPLRHVLPEEQASPSGLPVGGGPASSPPSVVPTLSGTHAVPVAWKPVLHSNAQCVPLQL
jgi:hypothetical protein